MPIDRVQVRFTDVDPHALRIHEWDRDAKVRGKLQLVHYGEPYRNLWVLPDVHFRFVFRAVDHYLPDIRNSLLIGFNPVKVSCGCNHNMISDWGSALDLVNDTLHREPGMDSLEIRDGVLYRIEVAANLPVGENAAEYIAALWKARLARRRILPFIDDNGNRTGLKFPTKLSKNVLVFYLKGLECGHAEANGMLRIEDRILSKPLITEKFGVKNLTLGALKAGAMWGLLEADTRAIGLDRPIISDRIELERALNQIYSDRQARALLGYTLQKQSRAGHEGMIRAGTSRQSISRFEKLLAAADVTSFSLDGRKTLPPILPVLRALRNDGQDWSPLRPARDVQDTSKTVSNVV